MSPLFLTRIAGLALVTAALVDVLGCTAPSSSPQAPAPGPAAAATVAQALPPANRPSPDKDRWMAELSNAGRWGADDERGAANLITAQKRLEAMALVKTGTVISLMRPVVLTPKSAAIAADQKPDGNPYFEMRFRTFPPDSRFTGFSSDIQEFAMHGPLLTHLDAFCHDSYNGRLYNNLLVQDTIDPAAGCRKLGVTNLGEGLVTRGVLVDFPRLRGSKLEASARLTPADLEAWETQTGTRVRPGDAVLLYTGLTAGKPDSGAGYDLSMMPWFRSRDVALIGADGPNADHQLSLSALGVYLLDNVELGVLADSAAKLKRWEFLLIVAPAGPAGATGAVVNPLAVF